MLAEGEGIGSVSIGGVVGTGVGCALEGDGSWGICLSSGKPSQVESLADRIDLRCSSSGGGRDKSSSIKVVIDSLKH